MSSLVRDGEGSPQTVVLVYGAAQELLTHALDRREACKQQTITMSLANSHKFQQPHQGCLPRTNKTKINDTSIRHVEVSAHPACRSTVH